MPGNLEAPPSYPNARTESRRNRRETLIPQGFRAEACLREAGVKGGPKGRRSEPLTPALATRPTKPTIGNGAGPAGALHSDESHPGKMATSRRMPVRQGSRAPAAELTDDEPRAPQPN